LIPLFFHERSEFLPYIYRFKSKVPWLFEVSRVEGITTPRVESKKFEDPNLDKVIGGAIDFRSPGNYIFLPQWMIAALALQPFSVVDVRMVTTIPPGSMVRLRPHSSDFVKIANHQAVLETELKHYSALTKGCTIPFDYIGKRFYFDVVELRSAPRGERVPMAKVQDCDIAAEFVRAKDAMKKGPDKG